MNLHQEIDSLRAKVNDLEKEINRFTEDQKRYDSVLNNVKEIVFQTNSDGIWIYLNRSWAEITGFLVKESLGKPFLDYVHPDDRELNLQRFMPLIQRKKEYCRHIIRYLTKDGGYRWIEVFARLTLDENDNPIGTSGTLNDVHERILMEEQLDKYRNHLEELVEERTKELYESNEKLSYLATHDSLTKIPNRYFLEHSLQKVSDKAKNEDIISALLFIDLDNFKVINDNYGYFVGDETLVKFSNMINEYPDEKRIVARLGGDEFGVLLDESTMENANQIAESIRSLLDTNDLELPSGITINITASIGIVKIDGSLTAQELLSYADMALYAAKDNGKNRVAIIESRDDKTRLSEINNTVKMIKSAIKENRFLLHYQPIVRSGNGIEHYEALIRMLDQDGKVVPPNDFIPIAERFGLMSQIDRWVLSNALIALKERSNIHIFINLSGHSLGDQALLSFIEESIRNSGIDPVRLGFEITETSAVSDLTQSEKWIKRLKMLGCKFALDDFGVGFSSFSNLGNLPVDFLKIDGSFVRNLDKDPKQKVLVQAINAVAHALGKHTIAEFVENKVISEILEELKVDYFQGYYIGEPQLLEYY